MLRVTRTTFVRGLAAVALSMPLWSGAAGAQTNPPVTSTDVKLSLVIVNDIDQMNDVKGRGGLPKYAAVVAAERARNPNTLAIHAGDAISPCLLCGLDQGAHVIDILNTLKPDIFVPGNHEFDFGKANFLKRMGEATFPVISANIRMADGSAIPNVADTRVVEMAGLKIGVVGTTTEDTVQVSSSEDIKFAPLVETTLSKARELRRSGADLVMAVVHAPRDHDFRLAESRALDVIVTGHDHDLRVVYDGRTAMVESSSQGDYVTIVRLDVNIRTEGDRKTVTWRPTFDIIDSASVTPDPVVLAKVKDYEKLLDTELAVEIGKTATPLDSRRATVRGQEAAIGNLIADAIKLSTGADVAITNGGGIRANKEYAAGSPLTRRDVLSELPFGNATSMVALSGKDLKAALENGFSQIAEGGGRFPQVSGLKIVVDPKAMVGQRVVSVEVNGAPLDEARTYKVATNDFMLRGGDGYTAFRNGKVLIGAVDGKLLANEVMVHIRRLGTVEAKVEGRITFK
jgi:2',3'-cyclic-nucleotide 2'-phosphodiesterase (5'-nucleotidase family)